MTDHRFYVLVLVGFGSFVISAVLFLNVTQPKGVDVELLNRITTPATTIIGLLVLLISTKSDSKKTDDRIDRKADEVKVEIHAAPTEIKHAAEVAKARLESAAVIAAKTITETASKLAEGKHEPERSPRHA